MIQSGSFSLGAWVSKIRSDLPAVWASGLGFWPVVDFISYKVVPVQWIPLFVNFCSFVWNISLVTSTPTADFNGFSTNQDFSLDKTQTSTDGFDTYAVTEKGQRC